MLHLMLVGWLYKQQTRKHKPTSQDIPDGALVIDTSVIFAETNRFMEKMNPINLLFMLVRLLSGQSFDQREIEARQIEQLLIHVFKHTHGCHYTYRRDGKDITKTPRFNRVIVTPEAHEFYVMAARKTWFGWRWMLPHGVNISTLSEPDVIANMSAATMRTVSASFSDGGELFYKVSRPEWSKEKRKNDLLVTTDGEQLEIVEEKRKRLSVDEG